MEKLYSDTEQHLNFIKHVNNEVLQGGATEKHFNFVVIEVEKLYYKRLLYSPTFICPAHLSWVGFYVLSLGN